MDENKLFGDFKSEITGSIENSFAEIRENTTSYLRDKTLVFAFKGWNANLGHQRIYLVYTDNEGTFYRRNVSIINRDISDEFSIQVKHTILMQLAGKPSNNAGDIYASIRLTDEEFERAKRLIEWYSLPSANRCSKKGQMIFNFEDVV